jgi:phosphatidylserine/phosphatidylglycerophosphate/cardiolipin synthase-like enzyme
MKKNLQNTAQAKTKNTNQLICKRSDLFLAKTLALSFVLTLFGFHAKAQIGKPNAKIKVYFTKPVDNTFSSGVNATYLNNVVFDTLAAYINRAKYTIDLCQYEYQTYTGDPIYVAINSAYTRGVKIRYIQDGSQAATNTGVSNLNASIPVVASPTTTTYGISHNKFVIIDEYSPDTTKAVVWTGSPDWDATMSSGDYNNVIIFQSKQLAQAYTHEFNIMWGDTTHGGAANATAALFGPKKPNSGSHIFMIGGSKVELYFSPSDGVNNEIVSNIATATVDLYCGMFTFTETTDATDIVNRKSAGAYTAVILDKYSSGSYTPYTTTFPNGLSTNFTGYNSSNTLYHNKYMIVNPSAPCDDPKVLTGSHNWTSGADTKNDENTVIVHNDTVANIYLQAFANDFKVISTKALTKTANTCTITGVRKLTGENELELSVFPNPFTDAVTVKVQNAVEKLTVRITDQLGRIVSENEVYQVTEVSFNLSTVSPGVYFVSVNSGNKQYTQKLIK